MAPAIIKVQRREVVRKSSLSNVKTSADSANDPLLGRSENSLKASCLQRGHSDHTRSKYASASRVNDSWFNSAIIAFICRGFFCVRYESSDVANNNQKSEVFSQEDPETCSCKNGQVWTYYKNIYKFKLKALFKDAFWDSSAFNFAWDFEIIRITCVVVLRRSK